MTQDEFQHRYHDWISQTEAEAVAVRDFVNEIGVDGAKIVAVEIPQVGWCLMIDSAVFFLHDKCGMHDVTISEEK